MKWKIFINHRGSIYADYIYLDGGRNNELIR